MISCYFNDPAGSGTLVFWSAFYVHLGLQIGAQFCPDVFIGAASAEQTRVQVGRKIEFFLSEMYVNGWFFDIYIQGSKKIQL